MPKRPAPQGSSSVLTDVMNLIRTLGERASEAGSTDQTSTTTKQSEFTLPGGTSGVFGVSIRVGLGGGEPVVHDFGNVKMTEEGVVVSKAREPLVDVFDEGAEIVVVLELPGVARDDITLELAGDIISLSAEGQRHRYECETLLPAAVDPASVQESYQNGYLQLRYRKAAVGSGDTGTATDPSNTDDA